MKKLLLSFVFILSALSVLAQRETSNMSVFPGGKCFLFRVTLRDKAETGFSIDHPEAFLSQRALERRRRQHIAIDSTDLPVSQKYIDAVATQGISVVGKSKWNNSLLVRCAKPSQMTRVEKLPFVTDVKLVFSSPKHQEASVRASFRKEFQDWDTLQHHPYGITRDQINSLNGIRLHAAGYRGKGMMIAVLDAGFMNVDKIPAFHALKLVGLRDFVVPRSPNIFQEMEHGTKVLSVMAVNQPDIYVGSAPQASYMLLRSEAHQTESLSEEDFWTAAVEFADSAGVDVINSSLGYHEYDDKATSYRYSDLTGCKALISRMASMVAGKGIVLVNSAGNDGMGTWKKINVPADAHDILTVGSISPNGLNAAFSSVGPTADGRVKPDVVAYGSPTAIITGRGTIVNDMGTSFSAPLVAGLVACLWQALPEKSAREIIELVRQCGNNVTHPDNVFGYGLPDFWKAYTLGKKQSNRHEAKPDAL